MGFWRRLFSKLTNQEKVSKKPWEEEKSLAEIWAMENVSDLVAALSTYTATKCGYGENISVLSAPERVFYITQILEMEVNNGGFSQFFFNSSGDFANEVVHAFTEIGAIKTAEICKKAVSIYGSTVPADRDERDDFLVNHDEIEEIIGECDNAFFACEEKLDALNYAYVMAHRDAFR